MKIALPISTALALLGLSTAAVTCSVYDASLLSSVDAGADADASVCEHATYPRPPSGQNLGDGVDFTTAVSSFDFGEQYQVIDQNQQYVTGPDGQREVVPARPTGFDLDGVCTANPDLNLPSLNQGPSCKPIATWFQTTDGDMQGGRDNGLRNVFQGVAIGYPGFGTQSYNRGIAAGKVSLLIRVKDYNGKADDDAVTVIFYVPGSLSDGSGNSSPPKLNGEDVWPVASESYTGGNENSPRLVGTGYVTNHMMVATFGTLDYRLRIGLAPDELVNMRVQYNNVFVTGRLFQDPAINNHWRIDQGQIAALWLTQDLLSTPRYFPNPDHTPGQPVRTCMNASTYRLIRSFICGAADISTQKNVPTPQCDAVSVGIAFNAVEVQRGPTVELDPLPDQCGYMDPGADSCLNADVAGLRADSGVPPLTWLADGGVGPGN